MKDSHDLQIWRAAIARKLTKHASHFGVHISKRKTGSIELRCFARCHGGRDVLLLRIPASEHGSAYPPLSPDPELASLRAKIGELEEANEKARFKIAELMQAVEMYCEASRHHYNREGHDHGVMTSPHKSK